MVIITSLHVVGDTSSVVPQYNTILGQGNISSTCTYAQVQSWCRNFQSLILYMAKDFRLRVEGQENDGNAVEITEASEEEILNSFTSYVDDITYKEQNTDKVIVDPFALQDVDFEFCILPQQITNVFPGATWS